MRFHQKLKLFIFVLGIFFLTGCSGVFSQESEQTPIRIFFSSWPGDYPLVIADALGFYDKYGVEVELIFLDSYKDGIVKFINKEIDTLNTSIIDVILIAQDTPVQVVWTQDNSLSTIVSTQDISMSTLRGLRVGVDMDGGYDKLVIDALLKNNGLNADDVILVDVASEDVPNSLGKTIDLGYAKSPFSQQAVSQGHKILTQLQGSTPNVMMFHTQMIRERPEDIQALVDAWSEAVLYWEADPLESAKQIAQYYQADPASLSLGLEEGIDTFSRLQNQEVFTSGWTDSLYEKASLGLNYLIQTGGIRRAPDLSSIINGQFVGLLPTPTPVPTTTPSP